MYYKMFATVITLFIFLTGQVDAWLLPYSNPDKYPESEDWDMQLRNTWKGYKTRYIDAYSDKDIYGLVFDPSANHAVSEGIGYGLLISAMANDQEYFNIIFDAAEDLMWNGIVYDWKCDENGKIVGNGGATGSRS